jgi:hypothetical protein
VAGNAAFVTHKLSRAAARRDLREEGEYENENRLEDDRFLLVPVPEGAEDLRDQIIGNPR